MNKKLLESYQANKRLIERNKKKIEEENLKEISVVAGKVVGSSHDFPYIERRFDVQMNDPVEVEKSIKKISALEKEKEKAERDVEKVERFINGIKDVQDREIFMYRYIDGMKVVDVAKKIGFTKGRISQIISKYVKL